MTNQFNVRCAVIIKFFRSVVCRLSRIAYLAKLSLVEVRLMCSRSLIPVSILYTRHGELKFFISSRESFKYISKLLTREPEMIDWIDSFSDGDAFMDIGANIGTVSLYAGLKGHSVIAIEPSATNYDWLNKHIAANGLDGSIKAYSLALDFRTYLGTLNVTSNWGSGSNNHAGDAAEVFRSKSHGELFDPMTASTRGLQPVSHRQGAVIFALDDFMDKFRLDVPAHIKLDVDGLEGQILRGAQKTLKSTDLRTLMVRLDVEDVDYCRTVINEILNLGFKLGERKIIKQKNHLFVRE